MKDNQELEKSVQERLKDFGDLLKSLSNVDSRLKSLWLEIYDNAISDRDKAHKMFVTMLVICQTSSSEHAIHGRNITSYLDKMAKANDQLLKLSELIATYSESDDNLSADDIYAELKK
jgi:hypothetical protein